MAFQRNMWDVLSAGFAAYLQGPRRNVSGLAPKGNLYIGPQKRNRSMPSIPALDV